MKIIKTKFSNLLIFQGKKNKDSRGHLVEIFKQNLIKNKLKFDYFTTSKKNVLRGMHFQLKKQQDKLISVIKGKIIDFSIDLRKNSRTFGKIFKKELSDKNCISLLIPKGFAHGFYAMDKENIVLYKKIDKYIIKYQFIRVFILLFVCYFKFKLLIFIALCFFICLFKIQ